MLLLAQVHGFFPLLIEGDSKILINMVNKILQGTPSNNLVNSWRLVERIELIEMWLSTHRVVNFKHICRDGNKVANILANIGVDSGISLPAGSLTTIANALQLKEYNDLVKIEMA